MHKEKESFSGFPTEASHVAPGDAWRRESMLDRVEAEASRGKAKDVLHQVVFLMLHCFPFVPIGSC